MNVSTTRGGKSDSRREDLRLVHGRGLFLADLTAGALQAVFVRSTQARAHIRAIDTSAARGSPGVVGVFTGFDLGMDLTLPPLTTPDPTFAERSRFEMSDPASPCLATDLVHYVGEPIAIVVAENRYLAEDAAELVEVDYEELPAVVDVFAALSTGSPNVHDRIPNNVAARIDVEIGDVEEVFLAAPVVVQGAYRVGRHGAVPLETRGVLARLDRRKGRLEIASSTQIPHQVRAAICRATGWPPDSVRVFTPDVGGGFGCKANVYAEELVVAVVAWTMGRDVAWVEDRNEHLISASQGRDQHHRTRLAVDNSGKILAFEDEFTVDVGAGSLWTAGIIANTAIHLLGPYAVDCFAARGTAVFTNKTIVAQYRGAGRPEACFAMERSLDHAARRLDLDPIEIRRRNLLGPGDLPRRVPVPYRDGVPIVYDGTDYVGCLDECLRLLPRSEQDQLRSKFPQLRIGFGIGAYIEATGRGPYESGSVRLNIDGRFSVAAGSASAGQGHETTLAQVAAEALGVEPEAVRVIVGDTDAIPYGIGTFASRSAVLAGSAIHQACTRLRQRAQRIAAELLDVDELEVSYRDGTFEGRGADRTIDWTDMAAALAPNGTLANHEPLAELSYFHPPTVTWTMGVHAVIVGVDPQVGSCQVLRYAVAHEGGREISPRIVEGQIRGAVAQGIGGALLEDYRYAPDGQPLSSSLIDYLLPTTCDVPNVRIAHRYAETNSNPIGVRGVGESGTIASSAAIAGAIDDALGLDDCGVAATPILPATLLELARERVS